MLLRNFLPPVKPIGFAVLIVILFFLALPGAKSQMRKLYVNGDEFTYDFKISFYTPSEGYVAFYDGIGFTSDSGHTFIKKPVTLTNVDFNQFEVNVTFGFGLNGVKAFNRNNLLAYGDYGKVPAILYSSNAGATWKLVYHNQFNPLQLRTGITDMIFPQQSNIGFAVDADRILKTTDGGLTWSATAIQQGSYYNRLEAVDDNNVFAICNGPEKKINRSTNGKDFFLELKLPPGGLYYATFITPTKGWVNTGGDGNDGILYYTENAGVSWMPVTDDKVQPFICEKMKFINETTGYAIMGHSFAVYKTVDGGGIWEKVPRDNDLTDGHHKDIFFLNNDQFWAGGDRGLLEMNTNAGGPTLPVALFKADTTGLAQTGSVNLNNYSRNGYQYQWFLNNTPIGTGYNAVYSHDIYMAMDTVMLVLSDGVRRDTARKYLRFDAVPYPPPVVTAFTPASGLAGTVVTITGDFFVDVRGVSFGDVPAASWARVSTQEIRATVGEGANGAVAVTTVKGTGGKAGFITYPPPVVTSIAPLKAAIGAPITIHGSNFSEQPGNNTVYFGSVKAIVTAASASQLTVTVPAGALYGPITVTVNKHTAYSAQWFSTTFASICNFTDATFADSQEFEVGDGSTSSKIGLSIADFDGDGKNDIVRSTSRSVAILRNSTRNGKISFDPYILFPSGTLVRSVAVADFDGDGKTDMAVTVANEHFISVFKNTSSPGAISFGNKIDIASPGGPAAIITNDLDMDGKPDMAVVNATVNQRSITVFRNTTINGNISFSEPARWGVGIIPTNILSGDLDGDTKPDLVIFDGGILNSGAYTFSVYRNTSGTGTISFAEIMTVPYALVANANGTLGDFDGDGKLDISVAQSTSYTPGDPPPGSFYHNTSVPGQIRFGSPVATEGCSISLAPGDLDGDGKIDVYGACGSSSRMAFLHNTSNTGAISMQPVGGTAYQTVGDNFEKVAIADLDGDGKPDLVSGSLIHSTVSINRNILGEKHALAGKDTTICNGQRLMLGRFTAINHQYSWTSSPAGFASSDGDPRLNPAVTTSYFLEVTNPQGCVSYDTMNVKVAGPPPITGGGPDRNICKGSAVQLGSPAVAGYTYLWTTLQEDFSSTIANPSVSPEKESLYVLAVNNGSCIAKDTVDVNVWNYPVANAGTDKSVCPPGGANIGSTAQGSNSYSWASLPSGFASVDANPLVYPAETTTYYLAVTSSMNCVSRDTVLVAVNALPEAPVITTPDPLSFCGGQMATFTSSSATNNQWYRGTSLIPGATGQVYAATLSGEYRVRVSNGSCGTFSNTIVLTVDNGPASPKITATGPLTVCTGNTVVLTSSAATSNQWYSNGVKLPGSTGNSYVAGETGNYTVTVMGTCESMPSSAVIVAVVDPAPAPVISAAGPTSFCAGGSVEITSSAISGNQWYRNGLAMAGKTSQTIVVYEEGAYSAKVITGCESPVSNDVTILVTPVPPTPVIGQTGRLLNSSADAGNQWYEDGQLIAGANGKEYLPLRSGYYSATATVNGCMSNMSRSFEYKMPADSIVALNDLVNISPNPARDFTIIRYTGTVPATLTIDLVDLAGNSLMGKVTFTVSYRLDLSRLSNGPYILKITNAATGEKTQRVIMKM